MSVPVSKEMWSTMPGVQQILDQVAQQRKAQEPWKDDETIMEEVTKLFGAQIGKQLSMSVAPKVKPMPPKLPKMSADPARVMMQKELEIMYKHRCSAAARGKKSLDDVLKMEPVPPEGVKGAIFKEEGTILFKQGKYAEAREAYVKAIRYLLEMGKKDKMPSPYAHVKAVVDKDTDMFGLALACASNAAQCAIKEKNVLLVSAFGTLSRGFRRR